MGAPPRREPSVPVNRYTPVGTGAGRHSHPRDPESLSSHTASRLRPPSGPYSRRLPFSLSSYFTKYPAILLDSRSSVVAPTVMPLPQAPATAPDVLPLARGGAGGTDRKPLAFPRRSVRGCRTSYADRRPIPPPCRGRTVPGLQDVRQQPRQTSPGYSTTSVLVTPAVPGRAVRHRPCGRRRPPAGSGSGWRGVPRPSEGTP